jgi:hypothetical protein
LGLKGTKQSQLQKSFTFAQLLQFLKAALIKSGFTNIVHGLTPAAAGRRISGNKTLLIRENQC